MKIHFRAPGFGLTTDKASCGATPARNASGRIEEITCRECLLAKREQHRATFAATDRRFADRLDDLESGYRTHAKR
jgi:hypothetical protein